MPLRGQRAGALDRRVTVQVDNGEQVKGQWVPDWADLYTSVAAGFTPVTAAEQYRSGQRLATEAGTFRMRWHSEWTPDPKAHRLVYNGKNWGITGVQEVGRREAWDIMAEVRGTSGGG